MDKLPTVNEEICYSLVRELQNARDFIDKSGERISRDNPVIAGYLTGLVKELPQCCANSVLVGACVVYRMLEVQAEIDKMEKDLRYE